MKDQLPDPNSSQTHLSTAYELDSDLSYNDEDIKDVLQDASLRRPIDQTLHEKVSWNFA